MTITPVCCEVDIEQCSNTAISIQCCVFMTITADTATSLQTGMDRPAHDNGEEDVMKDGEQRSIVDVKVDGATRDGGVCVNYTTRAAAPGDHTDSAHEVRL